MIVHVVHKIKFIFIKQKKRKISEPRVKFWFATGGAGFCISRSLALRMMPIAGGGKFISIGERIRFPDDVTMGFVIGMYDVIAHSVRTKTKF